MVLVKKGPFFHFLFLENVGREDGCTIFLQDKTPFIAIKTKSSKSPKIVILPKGLTHCFGRKMTIFTIFLI